MLRLLLGLYLYKLDQGKLGLDQSAQMLVDKKEKLILRLVQIKLPNWRWNGGFENSINWMANHLHL